MKFLVAGAFLAAGLLFLVIFQDRMIYYPRRYGVDALAGKRIMEIAYLTGAGGQTAFYVPPPGGDAEIPERVWMVFGGNASLALDWYDFVISYPDRDAAFLLFDYPGYGRCEGKASPATILESSERALEALAAELRIDLSSLEKRLALLGHSLGAAAALQLAIGHQVGKIILISPFTTLSDMAARVVGVPLNSFLRHRFDNRSRLRELIARTPPPFIAIIHGDRDEVIPVKMGRELARIDTEKIRYEEIAGGDHNAILEYARAVIHGFMVE